MRWPRTPPRLRAALVLAAVLAGVPAAAAAPAEAKRVRVFAVGPKLDLAWMESRQTYRDKMFALADRSLRGPGKPLIQDGADDFASHLLSPSDRSRPVQTARDLVTFPEDVGLFAALTGPRAAPARSSGSLEGSILTLAGLYGPQNGHYTERYPELAGRPFGVRLLFVAATDTFGRVVIETFADMADRYDVYLHAGANMVQDWQVVCTNREAFNSANPPRLAGGVRCAEESPQKVQRLRDPFEPERDYAYEATTPKASNIALLFDPDGRLISKQVKSYLTPTELPGQFDLVAGDVSGLDVVRTPVGNLGFVTSKDAWMPDVVQKLDQRHVDLLVQPEFFVGRAGEEGNDLLKPTGMWGADTLRASGYNAMLRHPSIETLVLPELVGNIFNFSADAQGHIAVEPRRAGGSYLAGQPNAPGMNPVLPFVVPDPERPGEPFPDRRRRLGAAGLALAPGSGVRCPDPAKPGPCENGHVETVLFRDVEVGRRPRYRRFRGRRARTQFTPSRPVRPSRNSQRNAALAMRGRSGVLAYEERRGGRDEVLVVRTANGGRTWSRAVRPGGRPRGDQWWPAVALGARGRVTLAWVDRSSGRERVVFARSTNGGRRFGRIQPLDGAPPPEVAQWRPALAQGSGDLVHAAFIDERTRSADDNLPQAGLYYTRVRGGRPEAARRLDGGRPVPRAEKYDHSWAPSVDARANRVLVTWLDFLNYDWDVFARLSTDGGGSFAEQAPVNDTPEDDAATSEGEQREALNDSPQALLGLPTPLVAWTDFRKRDSSATVPHQAYDTYLSAPGGPNRQVDPYRGRQLSTFSPSACVVGRDVLVAFQDAGRGQNDVRIARVARGVTRGRAWRIDDSGFRRINAWRPRIACPGRDVVAVWEDERDGPPQIYSARTLASRLRLTNARGER